MAAVGLAFAIKAAKQAPSPPGNGDGDGEVAEFAYVSDLVVEPYGGPNDIRWTVNVANISAIPGELHLEMYERMEEPGNINWSGFTRRDSQTALIAPGETQTFTGTKKRGPYTYQIKIESEAGTLLNPSEPKEFICWYHLYFKQQVVSFATQEELDAHFTEVHPQFAPMPRLEEFSLQGLVWPEHFTKYGEDLGRIIEWRAVCLLSWRHYLPDAGWKKEHYPDTGNQFLDITQPSYFVMPSKWKTANSSGIPNSTIIRLWFKTDQGATGFLDDSKWLKRIPNGATITFEVTASGSRQWTVT